MMPDWRTSVAGAKRYASILASRGLGTVLQFAAQVAVGQLFGATVLGALSVAQSWTSLLGTIGAAGAPSFVLRRTALRQGREPTSARQKWLRFGWLTAALFALVSVAAFAAWMTLHPAAGATEGGFFLLLTCALGGAGFAIARVHMEELKGRGRVRQAVMMEFSTPFTLVLIACAACYLLWPAAALALIPIAYVSAFAINAGRFTWMVWKPAASDLSVASWVRRLRRSWRELASLMAVDLGNQLTAALPVLILAGTGSLAEAAVLAVALKLIGLTATISATLTGQMSRSVIAAYRSADRAAILRLFWKGVLLNGLLSAVVLIPMMIAPRLFLAPFGAAIGTAEAAQVLFLMAMLRLGRQFLGLSQLFLMASGRGHFDMMSQAASVALMFGVLVVTGFDSMLGIAIAASVATLARGLISCAFVISALWPLGNWRVRR